MWEYTEKVRDHYLNPRNVGEVENPDGIGEVGNITCGDALRLTFKLDKEGRISDIKFKTFGCGSAIASASILTEMCKGKTLEEVKKITNKDIADALGGLPKEKMHCSVMGEEALQAAIRYYESGGKTTSPPQKEGRVVCKCFNVTEKEIEEAVKKNNLTTIEEVTNFTKAGGACGKCHQDIQNIIDRVIKEKNENKESPKELTNLQKIDLIRNIINNEIKPMLQADGGDCELVDINGNVVTVKLKGHCAGCAFSGLTLINVIEKKLKEKVTPDIVVKEA